MIRAQGLVNRRVVVGIAAQHRRVVAKALEEGQFKLLTGDLSYKNAAEGHAPDKAAVLVELKGGKPNFLGWRRPASIPNP